MSEVAYFVSSSYARLVIADELPPALARRRQGKTCFNFKVVEPAQFEALDALTARVRAAL